MEVTNVVSIVTKLHKIYQVYPESIPKWGKNSHNYSPFDDGLSEGEDF